MPWSRRCSRRSAWRRATSAWPRSCCCWATVVPRHAEQEEEVLFDLARLTIDAPELEALGERAETVKAQAPTRPHPHLTGKPLLQQALGLPVAIADRCFTTGRSVVSRVLAGHR